MPRRCSRLRIFVSAMLVLIAAGEVHAQEAPTYRERYRPQYHFTPARNWMNDPNGLVYYDGEYHLFYQHNPFGDTWGHMSWGHAVSDDLVHWKHLPVALAEEDSVMMFSGSAVVDWDNTSGLGTEENPPMVAIYTGHHTDEPRQDQRIAYSLDAGRTWTKYDGNPVLDTARENFRDPKVFWYEPDEKWVMVVALPTERKVSFYASDDLKEWTHLSDFGPAGATNGIWECPDLFPLPVDGEPGPSRWVLEVDLGSGAVAGGSGGQYFIGHFDGMHFTADDRPTPSDGPRWLDYGKDFYAVQSWSGTSDADDRRLWIAWMNNWQYAEALPTSPWRSAQTIPRRVMLRIVDGEVQLLQKPVVEMQRLRGKQHRLTDRVLQGTMPLDARGVVGSTLELVATFDVGTADEVGLKVMRGGGQETVIGYDAGAEQVFVDRTRSGRVDFHEAFASRDAGPLSANDGRVTLHVFVDRSLVEVFAGQGQTVITSRIFPDPGSQGVALFAEGGKAHLVSLTSWNLDSTWDEGP